MRGRPSKSEVRKKISAILNHTQTSYGYDIFKKYKELFGKVEMRTLYYNLQKGVQTREFIIHDIRREAGNYTWGNETERIYYANGPFAQPTELEKTEKIRLNRIEKGREVENTNEHILDAMQEIKNHYSNYVLTAKKMRATQRQNQKTEILNKITKLKRYVRNTPNELKEKKIETLNTIRDNLEEL